MCFNMPTCQCIQICNDECRFGIVVRKCPQAKNHDSFHGNGFAAWTDSVLEYPKWRHKFGGKVNDV